jgi:hypothetical protein
MRRLVVPIALGLGLCAPAARGATLEYDLELPSGRPVRYTMELPVLHAGTLTVEASWTGARVLAFRLEPPGPGTPLRRSGPSPLRLAARIDGTMIGGGPWTLSIRGMPAREAGRGQLKIALPDEPSPVGPTPVDAAAPAVPPPGPGVRPRPAPPGSPPESARAFAAIETFGSLVNRVAGPPDVYRWQQPLLTFLVERWDAWALERTLLADSSQRVLRRMVEVVDRLERLRRSSERGPADRQQILDLEAKIDALLHDVQGGHAPELEAQVWVDRFLACLTACERQVARPGALGTAPVGSQELLGQQWDRLLAAAAALDALVALP